MNYSFLRMLSHLCQYVCSPLPVDHCTFVHVLYALTSNAYTFLLQYHLVASFDGKARHFINISPGVLTLHRRLQIPVTHEYNKGSDEARWIGRLQRLLVLERLSMTEKIRTFDLYSVELKLHASLATGPVFRLEVWSQ